MKTLVAILLSIALVAACGDDNPDPPEVDAPTGSPDAAVIDAAVGPDSAPPADASNACVASADMLAQDLYQGGDGCAVIVRLDYGTRAILGYQIQCGPYRGVDEAQARATAQADTGYGQGGTMLNPPNPEDAYVFYEAPGDFGGAAAVSAGTGLTVFGGGIVWAGAGEITFPTSWRPGADLAENCPPSGGIPRRTGYDLRSGMTLAPGEVDSAVDVVAQTAVPEAMWRGGYVFDAVVLLYPRTIGAFEPATAEWIVIVDGGWLE